MAFLISLVLLLIGFGIAAYGLTVRKKAQASLSWPSVTGEIVHAAVLMRTGSTTSNDTGVTYKADVVYRYQVNGTDFSNSTISVADFASSSARAQAIVARYPDKASVDVFYNPKDPADSVLEPGPATGITVLFLIGGIFIVVGLVFLMASLGGHVTVH